LPEEVGEAGGSVCPSESLCGSIETASDDFALRRRLVILSAIKVLLDVRHVDGAIGKEGVGKDADGLACEFAEEALDACPARALRLGVALVVTVPLKTRAVLVLEWARRMRGVCWEGSATNLHPPMKKYSPPVVTLYRGPLPTVESDDPALPFPRERVLLHSSPSASPMS
jgi:hypothetical protein